MKKRRKNPHRFALPSGKDGSAFPSKFASDDAAVEYLAKVLVQAYLRKKSYGNRN